MTDAASDPHTVRTERIVLTIGLLLTYGVTVIVSLFFSVLAVGGGGEAIGVYVTGAAFLGATIGCFVLSLRLAARRKHVRAILLGLVPIPLVLGIAYGAFALLDALRLRGA